VKEKKEEVGEREWGGGGGYRGRRGNFQNSWLVGLVREDLRILRVIPLRVEPHCNMNGALSIKYLLYMF